MASRAHRGARGADWPEFSFEGWFASQRWAAAGVVGGRRRAVDHAGRDCSTDPLAGQCAAKLCVASHGARPATPASQTASKAELASQMIQSAQVLVDFMNERRGGRAAQPTDRHDRTLNAFGGCSGWCG